MNRRPKEVDYRVKNKAVQAGAESSPSRRAALHTFSDTKEGLIARNRNIIFEECQRALEMRDKSGCIRWGDFSRATSTCNWGTTAAMRSGDKLPLSMPALRTAPMTRARTRRRTSRWSATTRR